MTEPAELEKRLELLQGISIFFTLPDRDMRRLARKLQPRQVPRGEEVVKQGEVADRMHIIVSGRCEVRETWAPHHSVTVAVLGPGDFFGLSAIKGSTAQAASVASIEPCELLELLTEDIDSVLTEDSPVRAEVDRLVEKRRETIQHLVDRAHEMSASHDGRIIAVYSVKGGAGKTTLAVNLAGALSCPPAALPPPSGRPTPSSRRCCSARASTTRPG